MKPALSRVYVLMGPTGSGKTELTAQLDPDRFEIVSCDSRQVYRQLEIGTAAPAPEICRRLRHHLVGFLQPDEEMHAGLYVRLAGVALRDIFARGKQPILVGGTGFYYRALKTGLFTGETPPAVRARVTALGREERLKLLRELDPAALSRIHPNDLYRIGRALEVTLATGVPWSQYWERARPESQQEFVYSGWFLQVEPDLYAERLLGRARRMLAAGFVAEASSVFDSYGACPGLRVLGYSQALAAARGTLDQQGLLEALVICHRQYGKKQRTWLKRESELKRVNARQFLEEFAALGINGKRTNV